MLVFHDEIMIQERFWLETQDKTAIITHFQFGTI